MLQCVVWALTAQKLAIVDNELRWDVGFGENRWEAAQEKRK